MIGKVVSLNKKSITFENNYTGYVIYVSNPERFEINKVKKIYLYKHLSSGNKNNFLENLYGFENYETKELFLQLLTVSGIGPKTAINMCKNDVTTIRELIKEQNIEGLSALEHINQKYAKLIVECLGDVVKIQGINNGDVDVGSLVHALKSLGYMSNDIEFAIKQLNNADTKKMDLTDLISFAIKTIANSQANNSIVKTS
jgi:Holliday junction DNA helicase RuvA